MAFLVTAHAPDFTAPAILGDGRLDERFTLSTLRGRYVVLLFYPADFSHVCPTEMLAFDRRLNEFGERECAVVGISVDPPATHLAWRETPREQGGIGAICFPLVSDVSGAIARSYGVLVEDQVALRGLFLLDRGGVVRHALVNDQPFGRSVDEALRMVDALRFHDEYGELCPANWQKGSAGIKTGTAPVVDHLSRYAKERREPPGTAGPATG
jgi:peroxiredoxin (alkyl hydroperoxide reductase subunit C)